jgi:hypothetical protein
MLQPLVAAYDGARAVAAAALCPASSSYYYPPASASSSSSGAAVDELELAFRGDARDAFVWLHCLLAEERAWCAAEGCPSMIPPILVRPFVRRLDCRLDNADRGPNE